MKLQDLIGIIPESDHLVINVPFHRYSEFKALVSNNKAFAIEKYSYYDYMTFYVPRVTALKRYINSLNTEALINQFNPNYIGHTPLSISSDSQEQFIKLLSKKIKKEHKEYEQEKDRQAQSFRF